MKEPTPLSFPILGKILDCCEGIPAKDISLDASKLGLKISRSTITKWRANPNYCRPSFEKLATLLYVLGLMFEVTKVKHAPGGRAKSNRGRSVHSIVTRH